MYAFSSPCATKLRDVDETSYPCFTLPILNVGRYLAADIRLGWRPTDQVELFVVGQHLLAGLHPEFRRQLVISLPGEVKAELYGGLTWKF